MATIKCEKCGTEFEVTEKEASWMKVCRPCYAKSPPFKKASEGIKPAIIQNGREDCIMRQCALKCLAMQKDIDFDENDNLTAWSKMKANSLVEYMKKG